MSNEAHPLAAVRKMPPTRPGTTRREWLARAAFEGTLIAASLIAALALNEWKETRDRQARVRDAMVAIRLELRANREEIGRVMARNAEVAALIEAATKEGRRYEKGLLRRAQVLSTAWDSARAAAITNDMPFPMLMSLGRAYAFQADHERLFTSLYDVLLGGELGDLRGNPGLMLGLLNEIDDNARRLAGEYDAAVKALPAP
jgi:hypothetical protein